MYAYHPYRRSTELVATYTGELCTYALSKFVKLIELMTYNLQTEGLTPTFLLYIYISMALQPFVAPWSPF
jgi:hypothetical protein